MDRGTILDHLQMKGVALDAVHQNLGENAVLYFIVTKYARSSSFPLEKEAAAPKRIGIRSNAVDQAVSTGAFANALSSSFGGPSAHHAVAALSHSPSAIDPIC
jgi:hypothetical protein